MRLLRSATAIATLLLIVAGVPWLLLHTIGNPTQAWPDLFAGDINNQVVLRLLAAVAWIAWAQFTLAFTVELISGIRRTPVPRPLPGVFVFQQLSARALITTALLLTPTVATIIAPTAVALAAVAARPAPAAASPASTPASPRTQRTALPTATPTSTVLPTLTIGGTGPRTWWDIAEQHLGAGHKWSELWELNQGRPQPGGVRMSTAGPLKTGWTIVLPAHATNQSPTSNETPAIAKQRVEVTRGDVVVAVGPGDSLSTIAARYGLDWTALWQMNKGRQQPDGAVLDDPDYLEPGWTITIPTPPTPTPGHVQVQPGDTLSGIAQAEHVALQQLWNANENRTEPAGARFTDPDYLEPGWTITVPTQTTSAPNRPPVEAHPGPPAPRHAAPTRRQQSTDDDAAAAEKATEQREADQKAAAVRAEHEQAARLAAAQHAAERARAAAEADAKAAAAKEAREQRDADTRISASAAEPAATATPTGRTTPISATQEHGAGSSVTPVLLTGGGGLILAGLVVAALRLARRRQFRWRRPGRSVPPTPPELLPIERALLGNGRQAAPDVAWLDHAIRSLAASLAATGVRGVPPVVAARLAADELELVMVTPTFDPPVPWTVDESGLRWTVARTAELPLTEVDRQRTLAPFPALATVGHTAHGEHWLLDLEMIGALTIRGNHTRAVNLARYLAAELAHNTWSDSLQVTLVGFGQEMVTANPDRLTYTADPDDAHRTASIKTAAVHQVSTESDVDVARGRLHNIAGDTWATHVLLIDSDNPSAHVERPEPWAELDSSGTRQALAVVLIDLDEQSPSSTQWTMTVTKNGTMHIPALDLYLTAEQLPASEAAALAQLLALATRTDDETPTPSDGDQPWDTFADTAGALAADPDSATAEDVSATRLADAAEGRDGSVLPLPAHTYVAAAAITEPDIAALAPKVPAQTRYTIEQADPTLDEDVADWHDPDSRTPKVTVLGPIDVRAQGALDPQRPRRAWNVEVVTYLATRPHGATAEKLGSDLWPDEPGAHEKSKLRNAISTARRWLGPNPKTGRDHLPVNPGTPGSVYRVEDVLVDAELFRRLRVRAAARAAAGITDLEAALHLVTGPPFDALRPGGYGWLADQAMDHAYTAMIADVSHLVATHHLAAGNPEKAMAAAQVALLAGSYADEPLLDCAAACYAQGLSAEGASYVRRILTNHDAEVEEELPPRTYEVLRRRGWVAS